MDIGTISTTFLINSFWLVNTLLYFYSCFVLSSVLPLNLKDLLWSEGKYNSMVFQYVWLTVFYYDNEQAEQVLLLKG